jgi:serine/threonine protein kinase
MGVVYEAIDRERGARVALKTLRTWTADAFLRFKDEFRALQDLQHPNLVTLGELLEEQGLWFFTMELIHGVQFLTWVTAGGPRPGGATGARASNGSDASTDSWHRHAVDPDDLTVDLPHGAKAAEIASTPPVGAVLADEQRLRPALGQLAQGLNALHRARKVHRDIKPSNILVTHDGKVKILDFGVVSDLSQQQWRDDYLVGTVSYMAPEQASSPLVGPAADWYSVGVLMYQALTGRLPFTGRPEDVVMMKQALEPPPPRAVAANVPPDLDQLCVELLRIEPRQRPSGREILRRLRVDDDDSLPGVGGPTPFFVGRRRELQTLRDAFSDSRKGNAITMLVHGESGVGKSALTRHFVDRLIDDSAAVVFAGHCYERESVPYKAVDGVIDALSCYLTALPANATAQLLPEELGLLGQVFPVMRRIAAVAQAPRPQLDQLDPLDLRARVFATVRDMFSRLGVRRPLVLVIDDLQWADVDSLALLAEVLRPPSAPPLLLVATLRAALESETGTRSVRQLVESLPGEVRQVHIESLPPDDARALVDLIVAGIESDKGMDREAIAREAAGHPLFIDELIRSRQVLGEERPVKLEQALWARIARLDRGARSLLEVVAVAGAPIAQETAAGALATEFGPFAQTISMLRSQNLVKTTGARRTDSVETYHDRVRNAVLLNLDKPTRTRWHRRLAAALETASQVDPETLSTHWRDAGEPEKAAVYASRAAEDAAAALAFDRAARLYRLAIELRGVGGAGGAGAAGAGAAGAGAGPGSAVDRMESARLHANLGDALTNAGRGAEAAEAYLTAAATASAADALELRRRAADQLLRSGHIDRGLDAIRSVLGAVGMKLPRSPSTALASLLARRAQVRLRGLGFKRRAETDLGPDELTRIDVCWSVGAGLGLVDNVRGSYFQSRGLLYALKSGEPFRITRAIAAEAAFSSSAGGPSARRTQRLLDEAQRIAREVDQPYAIAWAAGSAGIAATLEGRWAAALERCQYGEEMFRDKCVGVAWELAIMRWFSLWALAYQGRIADLITRVPLRLRDAEGRGDLHAEIGHSTGLANLVWLAADDPDEARRRGDKAMERWSQRTFHVEHWWNMLGQTQVDLYRGHGDAAYKRVTDQWRGLKASLLLMVQLTRLEATQLRARAAIQSARSRNDASECRALLARAERDANKIAGEKMPWSTPLAHLLRAGIHAARGDEAAALALLPEAATGLDAASMALYAAAARLRQGQVLGGAQGKQLVDAATRWMTDQGITNPARMTAMLAPGFED